VSSALGRAGLETWSRLHRGWLDFSQSVLEHETCQLKLACEGKRKSLSRQDLDAT